MESFRIAPVIIEPAIALALAPERHARTLRARLERGASLTEAQARHLMDLELSPEPKSPQSQDAFIDAMTDYAINGCVPVGYVAAGSIDWLLEAAAPNGRFATRAMFDLVAAILREARWAPQRLIQLLLGEIAETIATGSGVLRIGDERVAGAITPRDVALIRQLLIDARKGQPSAISRAEIDCLLAINTACATQPLVPGWADLFCKALLNATMTLSRRTVANRTASLAPALEPVGLRAVLEDLIAAIERYVPQTTEDVAIAALELQRLNIVTHDAAELCTPQALSQFLLAATSGTRAYAILFEVLGQHRRVLHPLVRDVLGERHPESSAGSRAA